MEPQLTIDATKEPVAERVAKLATVEDCPYRSAGHDDGFSCDLLHQIVGMTTADRQICGVRIDACRACVAETNETGVPPTAEKPNRVIASLAMGIGGKIGGETGAAIVARMRPFIPHSRVRRPAPARDDNAVLADSLVATIRKSRRFVAKERPESTLPFRWSVGITAAPRKSPTLERTLRSLHAAGWSDVTIFAEPGTCSDMIHPPTINFKPLDWRFRPKTLNAWGNWLQSLRDLVEDSPDADAYFLAQDDVAFARGAREFLEATLWPGDVSKVGLVSIYCPTPYAGEIGYNRIVRGGSLIGALAWIIPPATARAILADSIVNAYHKSHAIDGTVGAWAERAGREVYYLSPSLAQHTGETSTVWGAVAKNTGHRRSANFVGDGFDSRRLVVRDGEEVEEEDKEKPTHRKQTIGGAISSAAGAAIDVMRHGTVDATARKNRREICNVCEHRTQKLGIDVCALCWCSISAKTAVPGQSCPLVPPKWGPVAAAEQKKSGCCGGK